MTQPTRFRAFLPALTQDEVAAEVRERYGDREISDGAARAIASWWKNKGLESVLDDEAHPGRRAVLYPGFTNLAASLPVTVEEIHRDITSVYPDVTVQFEKNCLDMLGTWAMYKRDETEAFRASLTPQAMAETRQCAVEELAALLERVAEELITDITTVPMRINTREQLIQLRDALGVRLDWHEPDEQGVSVCIEGREFDNACGAELPGDPSFDREHGPIEMQAYVYQNDDLVAVVNLADLFAFATQEDHK